jgi:hypothetical protein
MNANLEYLYLLIREQGRLLLPRAKITPGNTNNAVEQYVCQGRVYVVTCDQEGNVLDINDQKPLTAEGEYKN